MCPGLRQGSCHGAYVIRKWWEFGRHRPPLNLQGLEFQKGSKVNLLQALTKEKPERQVGEGPKGQAGAKLVRGYWRGESPRPQGSRSIWGAFLPAILPSNWPWALETWHLLTKRGVQAG